MHTCAQTRTSFRYRRRQRPTPSLEKITPTCRDKFAATANHRFQLEKSTQIFIRAHNEAPSVVAMCLRNPDCSPARIHAEMQPQLHPALLRLSAMIFRDFARTKSDARFGFCPKLIAPETDLNLARVVGGRSRKPSKTVNLPPYHSPRKRGNQVSEIGDFVSGALGSFTDCSRPLAAQVRHAGFVLWRICSLQTVRSLSGFALLAP